MTTTSDAPRATGLSRRTSQRRSGRARFHLPERRRGFERRADPSASPRRITRLARVRRISDSPRKTAVLMGSIVALNVADMLFTFRAVNRGLQELNPVMASLLGSSHGVAALIKIGVSAVLAGAGFRYRRFRKVIQAALLVAGIMSLVVLYHLLGLFAG